MLSVYPRMHIPDGFLSLVVAIIFWIISLIGIGLALRKVNRHLNERDIPLMGVLAAAIFAGQMLNFSVTGGTSGHLLGAALATVLLGPWQAILVLTCVVGTQALIFQDGGLVVLGANLFNMAITGVAVAHLVNQLVLRLAGGRKWGLFAGAALAGWASIFIASLSCALQLALSGTSPADVAIPAMAGIHALIGVGEALITLGAVSFIYAVRRDLLTAGAERSGGSRAVLVGGGVLTLVLVVLSPLASSHPDGLEWVAEENGFLARALSPVYELLPDYTLPGITDPTLTTILAGLVGVLLVLVLGAGVAWLLRSRRAQQA